MARKPYPGPPVAREFIVTRVDGRRRLALTEYIDGLHPATQHVIAYFLLVVAAFTDFYSGANATWSIFYLPPVAMLAWHRSWGAARNIAVAAGLASLVVDMLSHGMTSPPGIMLWNGAVALGLFLFVGFILAQLRQALREEHQMARTDDLTGVANSRSFIEFATLELARQRRYYHPLSLAFLDCDNFKRVNDFFGHAKGDELLRRIALVITQTLREVDVVARLGGDEFGILLPESDQKAAAHVMRKLRNALKPIGEQYGVTFSMGIVTFLEPADSVDQMLVAADRVMYEVKRSGKNSARHRTIGRFSDETDEQGVLPGF